MNCRLFSSVLFIVSLSGCSFFSSSTNSTSSFEPSSPIILNGQKIEHVLRSGDKPIITATKNGGKKYVVQEITLPMPPSPCIPSPFDKFPSCLSDFGVDGEIKTNTYYVDAKGFVYNSDYAWKHLPAIDSKASINYDRDPKPDADLALDFEQI